MLKIRKPTRVTETFKALVPSDSAIDTSRQEVKDYLSGKQEDPTAVPLCGTPTWVTLRAFTDHECNLLSSECGGNLMSLYSWTVRLCFVGVDAEGYEPEFTTWQGRRVLTEDSLTALFGVGDIRHLSNVAWARSVLHPKEALPFA